MKLFYTIILLMSLSKLFSQEINWAKTSNWKLYDSHGLKGYDLTPEKLTGINNDSLNIDSVRDFLSVVSVLPSDNPPVWMGHYIASCKTQNGAIKIIYISTYGGFFYDAAEKKYYQLLPDKTKDWLEYFSEKEASIQSSR
jgi:hypothetical protein